MCRLIIRRGHSVIGHFVQKVAMLSGTTNICSAWLVKHISQFVEQTFHRRISDQWIIIEQTHRHRKTFLCSWGELGDELAPCFFFGIVQGPKSADDFDAVLSRGLVGQVHSCRRFKVRKSNTEIDKLKKNGWDKYHRLVFITFEGSTQCYYRTLPSERRLSGETKKHLE